MKQLIFLFSALLMGFSAGCFTGKQQLSCMEEPLVTTKIWVDYEELFSVHTKSMFFVKLNDIINKQHPDTTIRIYVDSQLLPSLVVDGKDCNIFSGIGNKKIICDDGPKFSNTRLVTLKEVLKLYCEITVTCLEYKDSMIFIVPNKNGILQSSLDTFGETERLPAPIKFGDD